MKKLKLFLYKRLLAFLRTLKSRRKAITFITFITIITIIISLALFFRKKKSTFNPILTKAPQSSNYLYQNINKDFKVYLGSRENENRPLARFEVGKDKLVEFEGENLEAKNTKVKGNKILGYENIKDKYDITYQIIEKGLKEEIILKKKPETTPGVEELAPKAPRETPGVNGNGKETILSPDPDIDPNQSQFSFIISYPKEMEIKETLPNQLTFYEKDGGYLFHFAKPFMEDGKGEKSEDIKIKVRRVKPTEASCPKTSPKTPGVEELAPKAPRETPGVDICGWLTYRLTLIPDRAWLTAKERKYPVILDPTIIHDTQSEFSEGTMNRIEDNGTTQNPKLEIPYKELPADINTAGLWHLNETADNSCSGGEDACDSSGNDNHGTATGTSIADGKLGKARSFNGSSDYISLGNPTNLNFPGTDPFSIEAWVKPNVDNLTGEIFSKFNSGVTGQYLFRLSGGRVLLHREVSPWAVTGNSYLKANNWYHVAGTYDERQIKVYVNGVLDASPLNSGSINSNSTNVLIGAKYGSGTPDTFFDGLIDEVRVSNRALTPEEIAANASRRPYGIYTSKVIDFGQTPQSLNSLTWIDNITPPDTPTNWTKVKPVLIDNSQNSSGLSNYQVKVHVDYDSNMQTDFDDLKFTNSAGTNLDYWIESKSDGVEATVWVEVDSILANSWQTIFMFYGNGSASAASNIANTFIYGQAFTAANGTDITSFSGWSKDVDYSSTYTIDTNRLKMYHPGAAPNEARDGAWYTFSTQLDLNNMVEYKITIADSDGWDYMGEVTDTSWANMGSTSGAYTAINNESWQALSDSAWNVIQSGLTVSQTYKFGIRANTSSQGFYYIDDVYKTTVSCRTSCSNIKNLVFGNYGYATGNDTWYIDDLRVRKYTSPEPTAVVGASIEFQTRTSADNSTWEAWKPTTNETAIAAMDSDATNWTSSPSADFTQSWKKYDNSIPANSDTSSTNGRIPLGTATKGDDAHVYESGVLLDSGTYKMWYSGHDGTNVRLYYATSSDGLTWTKYDNTIPANSDGSSTNGRIPLGTDTKGDDYHTYKPGIIKDGSTYKMWYSGHDGSNWRIYYATSSDGLTWTKYDNSIPTASDTTGTNGRIPLGTAGKGDVSSTIAPMVIKDGSTYKMWYSGHDGSNWRIYYATSSDGLTWTKYDNTIPSASDTTGTNGRIPLGSNGAADDSHTYMAAIVKDGSLYKMWYNAHDGTYIRLAYAYSTDGLTWIKYDNSIAPASDGSSTNGRVPLGTTGKGDVAHSYSPTVVKDGNTYKMWYSGYDGSSVWRIYYATMDLTTLPTAKADDSTTKIEGTGSMKTTVGPPQVDSFTAGLWHLEETSGDANNSTPLTGLTLTASNSPGSADGFSGKGRTFNGSNQYFSCTDANCGGTSKLDIGTRIWSLGAWIKTVKSTRQAIIAKGTASGQYSYELETGAGSDGKPDFYLFNTADGAFMQADGTTAVNDNQWHLLVGTYDSTTIKIYIDGVLSVSSTTKTGTQVTDSTSNFLIGARTDDANQYFSGNIDEPFVKETAMTAEEISEAYRAGRDHRIERTLSSTDLSAKTKIPFFVAADRPGTYLETYIGETTNSVYGADSNTVGLWHLEEQDEAWGDTFRGTTIDTTKWTEIDPNNNKISQNNGLVLSAGALASWDSALISKRNFSRKTGNRIYASFTTGASVVPPNHMMIGWGQDQTAQPSYTYITHALYFNAGSFYTYQDGTSGGDTGQDYTTSTTYKVLLDLGSDGKCRYYVKGGAFTNWTLLATDGTAKTNSPLRVHMAQYQHTGTFNEIRVYPSIDIKDSSSSANRGITYGTTSTQGKIGKARSFNGSSDYVSVTDSTSLDVSSAMTLSVWIYPYVLGANERNIIAKTYPNTTDGQYAYGLAFSSLGYLYAWADSNGSWGPTWMAAESAINVQINTWTFLTMTFDGNVVRLYRNGVNTATSSSVAGTIFNSNQNLYIGHKTGWANYFDGVIDEVQISNTTRSAPDIQQAYQYGLRTHQITTDFVTNPQATYASGTSITINNPWGTTNLTDTLSVGDTIIIKENENGTEYIAQAEVTAITNTSSTYGTVTLKSAFSSIPPSGYTTNAKVFKWQREYWDLKDISEGDRNATTKLGIRILDASQGFTFWLDDFKSNSNYLYLPFGNTISSTAQRYFQYRAIVTADGSSPSAPSMENNLTPQIDRVTVNYTLKDAEKDGRPVAYWKFDEGYGTTAYDETVNNHDAVLNNMEAGDWITGYEGKALNLGGTDEYLSVANSADVNFGDHSMSLSAFVNTSSSGATYTILDKYNSSSKGYKLYLNSTGKVVFQVGDGTNTPSVTGNKAVNDSLWHSILAVRAKGSTLRIYVDGLLDNTSTDTANNIDSTVDVVIGRDSAGANYFIGKLDELNLYDYALSASQAKVVYNKGFSAVLGATEDVNKGGAGPVGYWKFDEAGGTSANDSSGNGNTGTLGVGSSAPGWVTQGKIGSALDFDGSNDYVDVANESNFDFTSNFSVEFWMKITTLATSDAVICKFPISATSGWDFAFSNSTAGALRWIIYDGSLKTVTSSVLNTGTWYHIVGVHDGSYLRLYVNGLSVGTPVAAGNVTLNNTAVRIAGYPDNPGYNFPGLIDHVKIYNYARSVTQIHADMAGSPIAYWKLDEGYGATAFDQMKNSNGTISAASWTNGKFGKALSFNGSASVTATITDPGYSNTLSLWLNPSTSVASKTLITASKLTTDGSSRPVYGSCTGTAISLNQWVHLVAVSDGSGSCKIYQNGVQTASSTTGVTFGTSVNIGASSYTGLVDEVKIYNYPLTADEIKVEYNQSSAVRLGNTLDINASGGNPVGFWKFDEASGTSANDSSGNGNTGTLGIGSSAPAWETNGKIGTALDFDGSNDYVSVPASSSLNFGASDPFTISLWIKTSNVNQNYGMFITRTTGVSEIRFYGTSGKVQTYWNSHCPRSTSCESTKVLSNNTWYHIALTYDQSTTSLYINGVLDVQGDYGGAQADTANLLIGKRSDGYNFSGQIDHVKIYNYARSVRQIAFDYNGGKPVGYWKLDEKTGTTAWDESDHNYDGTLEYMNDADHVVGKFGWALDLDGSNDRVNMGNPSGLSFGTGDFTVMAWFKTTTTLEKIILDKEADPDGSNFPGYSLGMSGGASAGKAFGVIRDADSDMIFLVSNRPLNNNQWHHAVIVRSGSSGYFYIDGVLEKSGTNAAVGSTNTSDPLRLGMNRPNDPLYFPGQIDEVRIYNYARSNDEVKMDYNNGAVHFK